MPTYPHLRLVHPAGAATHPAGQVSETPKRDALLARLGVPVLPSIALLPEALAATITDAEYNAQFCLPITVDGVTRYSPWCIPPVSGSEPTPIGPLVPGYGAGRLPPVQHYATWIGTEYVLGTEKSFLLGLPIDDYYRMVDKLSIGGPMALHQAIRIEATRYGVADPLADVSGLDAVLSAQQVDYAARGSTPPVPTPTPTPSPTPTPVTTGSALVPVAIVVGIGAVLYWLWPKSKSAKAATRSNPTNLDVANTILRQMGGAGRLKVMIGAKDFVGDANSLTFKYMKGAKNGTFAVRITLEPSDTYRMDFYGWPFRGRSVPEVKESLDRVYANDLIRVFESRTGLALRL